jgi:hypothetical protein
MCCDCLLESITGKKTNGGFQKGDAKDGKLAQKRLEGLIIHVPHGT